METDLEKVDPFSFFANFNRVDDARRLLAFGDDERDPYRIWLAAECARQAHEIWDDTRCKPAHLIDERYHVCGFVCQAIARQTGRQRESRLQYFKKARRSFQHGLESDVSNVKRVLSACCDLAIAVVDDDPARLEQVIAAFRAHCGSKGFNEISEWYEAAVDNLEQTQDWTAIDALFSRVPHL